ncbi:uncharacterized protein METZ01_LOCUS174573, partial [marine metagenome]
MTIENYKQKKDFNVIGTNPIRHDGYDKVTGRAIYGADVKLPNLIWGEVVRSTIAHGKIKSIDVSEAEKMEGVFAVITHKDFEKNNKDNNVNLARDMQNILAKDKVLY